MSNELNDEITKALLKIERDIQPFTFGSIAMPDIHVVFRDKDGNEITPPEGGASIEKAFERFIKEKIKKKD